MSETHPWGAVIIPHYNDVRRLLRCLDALMASATSGVEIVVVDNGSTEDLGPLRAAYPGLSIVYEAEKGAAMARNTGVRSTTAAMLVFLDADCIPAPDWLETAEHLAGRADLVGGRVDVFDETPPPRSGAEAFETVFAFDCRDYVEKKGFAVTANLIAHRKVFDDIGGFRTGVSEDLDWCRRATGRGYQLVYEDALRVRHPTRSDWPALRRKWQRLTSEAFGLQPAGFKGRLPWALRAFLMVPSALLHLPRVLASPRLSGPQERIAASSTLLRLRFWRMVWMLGQLVQPKS